MKIKNKGLSLHKETVRGLNATQLEAVGGGISGKWCSEVISCYQSCACDTRFGQLCTFSDPCG
jgi:hypothetical protein